MRSRYSAYSVSDATYIIQTTHTSNEDFTNNLVQWQNEILDFSRNYTFKKLTILEHTEEDNIAFVTFKASLYYHDQDHSFIERSKFTKSNNIWLYLCREEIE